MSWPRIVTIGVYGSTEASFFQRLVAAQVDLFCDVRARRGVRGSQYAFANSQRLQRRLQELGIAYVHRKDLAPSPSTRQAQWAEDARLGLGKRSRDRVGQAFVDAYRRQTLAGFDARQLLQELARDARVMALFCVEQAPEACHRSILASAIGEQLNIPIVHLT